MKKLGPKADPRKGGGSKKGAKKAWARETTELKRKGEKMGGTGKRKEGDQRRR